jgi:hypothetical protein
MVRAAQKRTRAGGGVKRLFVIGHVSFVDLFGKRVSTIRVSGWDQATL